jgi:hypothetical protein
VLPWVTHPTARALHDGIPLLADPVLSPELGKHGRRPARSRHAARKRAGPAAVWPAGRPGAAALFAAIGIASAVMIYFYGRWIKKLAAQEHKP